jgi:hypothetical protein
VKKHPSILEAGKKLNFEDLAADPVVMFQKRLDPWFNLFMCFVFPGLVCTLWGDSFWHGYWVAGAFRCVCVWHTTWLVNSAAHLYGDHPYDPASHPAENPLVSLFTLGEGWHNWHHKYPFDYAASEYGVSRQFNPTKLFIDTCCLLGLARYGPALICVYLLLHEYPLVAVSCKDMPNLCSLCGCFARSDCKRATGAWHKKRAEREQRLAVEATATPAQHKAHSS